MKKTCVLRIIIESLDLCYFLIEIDNYLYTIGYLMSYYPLFYILTTISSIL